MSLSPTSDPIPRGLVQRIQSGQFVEMRDLLGDNIALLNQLSSLHGTMTLPLGTVNRTRLREVPSLVSWLYCFIAYVAVRTGDQNIRDMLAYARLVIREALRHGGAGWLEYDRVFRRQLVVNPLQRWNTLEPGLLAATVLGQRDPAGGTYCTYCRECDHVSSQCALAPLQQLVSNGVRPYQRRLAESPICRNWNKGICQKTNCIYRHVCITCHQAHRARDCAQTPADSIYKRQQSGSSAH